MGEWIRFIFENERYELDEFSTLCEILDGVDRRVIDAILTITSNPPYGSLVREARKSDDYEETMAELLVEAMRTYAQMEENAKEAERKRVILPREENWVDKF